MKNRVLLVSSEGTLRSSISEVLDGESFDVLRAQTGQEALRTIRDHLVDVVILDDRTPFSRRDAAQVNVKTLMAITDASPFLPLVLTCDTTADLDHATSLMADMVITRPVKPTALLDAVDTVLEETLRDRAYRKAGAFRISR